MPPVIVKSADKANYLRALHDADSDNLESFVNYIAEQLLWSLELTINAAKNEPLEEDEDWKKKLDVLKKDLDRKDGIEIIKTFKSITKVVNDFLIPSLHKILNGLQVFDSFFLSSDHHFVTANNKYPLIDFYSEQEVENFFNDFIEVAFFIHRFKKKCTAPF